MDDKNKLDNQDAKIEELKLEPEGSEVNLEINDLSLDVDLNADSNATSLSDASSEQGAPSQSDGASDGSSSSSSGGSSDGASDDSGGASNDDASGGNAKDGNGQTAPDDASSDSNGDENAPAGGDKKPDGNEDDKKSDEENGDKENKDSNNQDKNQDDKKGNEPSSDDQNKNNLDNKESNNNNNNGDNKENKNDKSDKDKADNKNDKKDDNKDNKDNKDGNKNKDDKNKKSPDNNNNKTPGGNKKPNLGNKNKNNGAPGGGSPLANKLKNNARNALNNSKAGQAANKAADAARKVKKAADGVKKAATGIKSLVSFFSTPVGIAILIVILIVVVVVIIASLFGYSFPGIGGDVSNEENLSKYSEVDQKTIERLSDIYEKYPNGNPALAMAAVVYPYIEELYSDNVILLLGKTDEDENEEDEEDEEESEEDDDVDKDDLEDNENDLIDDDPYLELFRKWTYRRKFMKLLKETRDGEEEFLDYLRNDYFNNDKGYKKMFKTSDNKDELADAIIEDLLDLEANFEAYFFEICITNASYQSVGQVTVNSEVYSSMMQGNVVIDLLEAGCGSVNSCSTYATLTLEDYVKGVVYEEINGSITSDNIEVVKAQMVAVKSYTLSRRTPEQTSDGTYVIKMRWSTADQDYCDYQNGCENVQAGYGYNNSGDCLNSDGSDKCKHFSNHGPASEDVKSVLDQAWQETLDYYVLDSDGVPRGSYMASCSIGTCMSQQDMGDINGDFIAILGYFYTDYVIAQQEGDFTSAYVGSSTELCGEQVSGGIPDNEFKFYYQTDYPDVAFCGLDSVAGCSGEGSNTICTSGCGVTSYAMVIATLSDTESTFDPIAANDEATSSGNCSASGTSNGLFTSIGNNHSGFTIEEIPVTKEGANEVLSVLQNGGLVVANVQASSPFTDGGHWIVIRSVTSEGAVKVADPISEERSTTKVYDIYDFIDENWLVDDDGTTHSWYAIYGPKSEQYKYTAGDGVATGTLGYPVEGVTGCDASDYPNYSDGSYHGGTDINSSVGASEGMNILAADGGTVITVKNLDTSYGSHVIIDHGNGYTTLYAHMQKGSITVEEGDLVSKGQVLGKLGSTGNSTGPHLHIELRINNSHTNTLNPCDYIGQNKSYVGN